MDKKLAILEPFFRTPNATFLIREIAKRTKMNHMTARKYLEQLKKEGYLRIMPTKPYPSYQADMGIKFRNLKLHHNLEEIRKSQIIEYLEKLYDYPPIVLFGSFATAIDTQDSDIDLAIISNIKKEAELAQFNRILERQVSIHLFDSKKWNEAKKKNKELVNNICNGITLSGQLEIL